MKKSNATLIVAACSAAFAAAAASNAAITVSQGSSAPNYSNLVVFDSPVGSSLPTDTWAPQGISSVVGYDGSGVCSVLNLSTLEDPDGNLLYPWAPDTNVLYSAWGIEITFAEDVSSVSFRAWSNGGAPTFFGGGTYIVLQNDGQEVLFSSSTVAAWGGVGDEWFNITTTDGSTFDRLIFSSGSSVFPEQFISQVSWNVVPGPGSLALIGLAGLVGGRRRRA